MKTMLATVAAALLLAANIQAQTNAPATPAAPPTYPTVGGAISGVGQAIYKGLASGLTNVDGLGYFEWTHQNLGGGAAVLFRTSDYIAYGMALDYVDGWSAVNANLTFQAHTQPLKNVGWLPAWLQQAKLTPNLFSGLGTPIAGSGPNNWTLMTVVGGGGSVTFHSFKYFDIGGGYDRLIRNGTGTRDGGYNTVFLNLHIYVPGFSGSTTPATTAKDNQDYWNL